MAGDETLTETAREPPPRRPAIQPGAKVGRYQIVAELGRGGMGIVYRARDPELGRDIAIKVLHAHLATRQTRLLREGRAVAKLRHPNVITIHDVGTHGDDLFIAMELVEGSTLKRWLSGSRGWREIIATLAAAGAGLAAAHAADVIHRDFKPDNVLIGNDGRIVVTDFGLASETGERNEAAAPEPAAGATHTGAISGTPAYMSPEQFRDDPLDARSDQFSFCVALYAALYRQRPFGKGDVESLREAVLGGKLAEPANYQGVPRTIRDAIAKGLALEPQRRHASMTALLGELAVRGRRRWVIAAAGTALLGAAAGIYVIGGPRELEIDPCLAASKIDAVWNEQARAATRANLTNDPYADEDARWFEQFAMRWKTARVASCRATGNRANDARASCLDRALTEFQTVIGKPIESGAWGETPWPRIPSLLACDRATTPSVRSLGIPVDDETGRSLSADGTRLANIQGGRLHISDLGGSDLATFELPKGTSVLSWPAANRLIVGDEVPLLADIGSETRTVWSLDPATGAHTNIDLPPNTIYLSPTVDRALVERDRELFVVELPGGVPKSIGRSPCTENPLQAAWAPSRPRLALECRSTSESPDARLHIFDIARGTRSTIVLRAFEPFGNAMISWASDDELLFDGRPAADRGNGVWRARLDAEGRLVEVPELRIDAEPSFWYQIYSYEAGRAIAQRTLTRTDTIRAVAGSETTIPGTHASEIIAIADDGSRLLVTDDDGFGLFSFATKRYRVLDKTLGARRSIEAGHETFAFAANQLVAAGRSGVTAIGDDGSRRLIARLELPAEQRWITMHLRCSNDGKTCVVSWRLTDNELVYRRVREGQVGSLRTISRPHRLSVPVVSHDGRSMASRGAPGHADVFDVETGELARVVAVPSDQTCPNPQQLAWGPDALYVSNWCLHGRSRVVKLADGRPPQTIHDDGKRWVAGLAVTGKDELYMVLRDWTVDTVLIEGL